MKNVKKLLMLAAAVLMLFGLPHGVQAFTLDWVFPEVGEVTEITKKDTTRSDGKVDFWGLFKVTETGAYKIVMKEWPYAARMSEFGGNSRMWSRPIKIDADGNAYYITPVLEAGTSFKIYVTQPASVEKVHIGIYKTDSSYEEIQLGETKTGSISSASKEIMCSFEDTYKLVIPEDGDYIVKAESQLGQIAFYDENFKSISGTGGTDATGLEQRKYTLKAGTYYAGFSLWGTNVNKTTSYRLSVWRANGYITKLTVSVPEIKVGTAQDIYYKAEPAGILDAPLFTSSNPAVARFLKPGDTTIRGVSAGSAVITATNGKGDVVAKFTVTVKDPNSKNPTTKPTPVPTPKPAAVKAAGIQITGETQTIAAGKSIQLYAQVIPANTANKNVTWSSSNTKYATVSANGKVTTKKAGKGKTVMITAKTADGSNKTASYKLKIARGIVKKVKISGKTSVKAGKTLNLKARVSASSGANKKVVWASSNTKYATISQKGKLTALKAGKKKTVKITARAVDGSGKKATIKIKIK